LYTSSLPALCCPQHGQALVARGAELECPSGCRHAIRDGIPRFVANDAYASAFGLQWLRYQKTQLDSYSGVPVSARRLERCFGPAAWSALRGARVLEAGCGAGRFTEVLLGQGAAVASIDLSEAVVANARNFPVGERHVIAQADIFALPFAPGQFDAVMCIGVLQHTPSPEQAIAALARQVRPGGWLVIDHYAYTLSWYTKTAPLFRAFLRRMSPERGLRATEAIVEAFLPMHRAVRSSRVGQALVSRVSPVICFYQALPELDDRLQEEWAFLDTHDSLTDWYKHFRTAGQLRRCLVELGLDDIWAEDRGSNVEARGRRPSN
jgi:2-polyprenyl-3-methyl-5-hydroxy-6-metoxy-1,4-benzoquinol methylase